MSMDKFKVEVDKSFHIKEIEVNPIWIDDLGDKFLEYRKKWDNAGKNNVLYGFPLFIEVESSYSCNYNCIMCPRIPLNHQNNVGELSTELFDKLFKEAKEKGLSSINLSHGGEPLLNKNIINIVKKSKEAGILDILIHTNGSLLTKEISKNLVEAGLTKINFSLDAATEETYKKVRIGGDFNKVMKNFLDFLEVKKKFGKSYPRVRVSFVYMDVNKHESQQFLDFWKDKANLVAFQDCRDYSKDLDDIEVDEKKEYLCEGLWHLMMISADGSIMPCLQDYRHECTLGNLKTHTIEECWKSEKMGQLRKMHLEGRWHEIPMCRRCVSNVSK